MINSLKKLKLWCPVSTHDNEELFCSKVQEIIKKTEKESLCIIIPRHVNRTKKIFTKLNKLGFKLQIKNENDTMVIRDCEKKISFSELSEKS